MMRKHSAVLLLIAALFFSTNSLAQLNEQGEEHLKEARKSLYNQEFDKAKKQYLKVVEQDDSNPKILFEFGLSYFKSNVNPEESIPFLEKALNISEDTISENLLYLAKAYHHDNQFLKAKNYYNYFLEFYIANNSEGKSYKQKVARWINMCDNGMAYNVKKESTEVENLSENINTKYHEYAPVFDDKGNIIYYTSRRPGGIGNKIFLDNQPYEDIYFSIYRDSTWSKAKNINKNKEIEADGINSKRHDATINISNDGETIFIYKDNEVWKSHKNEEGAWEEPMRMNNNVNFGKATPSVFMTEDEQSLYIVSLSEEKGFGGRDIYISTKSTENEWREPQNLGKNINTPFDEDAPYLTDDGETLYFSSKGHSSIGGFDIFKSTKDKEGNWQKPKNLGMPTNSGAHDIYYSEFNKKNKAYFSSDRTGSAGRLDIYAAKFDCKNISSTKIRGLATVQPYGYPAEGKITVYDKENDEALGTYEVDPNSGEYTMILPPNKSYYMKFDVANAQLNRPYRQDFSIPKQCENYNLYQDITLDHIEDQQGSLTASEAHFKNAFFDVEDKMLGPDQYNIDKKAVSEKTMLEGSIQIGSQNEKDINVYLLNDNNEILKISQTNNAGIFAFSGIDTAKNYKILFNHKQIKNSLAASKSDSSQEVLSGYLNTKNGEQKAALSGLPIITSKDLMNATLETQTSTQGNFTISQDSHKQSVADNFEKKKVTQNINYKSKNEVASAMIKLNGSSSSLNISEYIDRIEMDQQAPDSMGISREFANLLFDFDKYFLRDKSKSVLENLSAFLEEHPEVEITFSGHTDWIGTEEYNLKLSENRSKSAEKYMTKQGVANNRITKEWFGESQPVVPNENSDGTDNPENRQLNRRVEIKLTVPRTAELILSL